MSQSSLPPRVPRGASQSHSRALISILLQDRVVPQDCYSCRHSFSRNTAWCACGGATSGNESPCLKVKLHLGAPVFWKTSIPSAPNALHLSRSHLAATNNAYDSSHSYFSPLWWWSWLGRGFFMPRTSFVERFYWYFRVAWTLFSDNTGGCPRLRTFSIYWKKYKMFCKLLFQDVRLHYP